jgi:large subunit ribosomal protein LP2
MDLVSASLMLHKTENKLTEDNFRKLYKAINATVDEDTLSVFIKKIENMSVEEIIQKGGEIISSLAVQVSSSQAPVESKKEEVKKEVKEEEPVEELSLFGDDDLF